MFPLSTLSAKFPRWRRVRGRLTLSYADNSDKGTVIRSESGGDEALLASLSITQGPFQGPDSKGWKDCLPAGGGISIIESHCAHAARRHWNLTHDWPRSTDAAQPDMPTLLWNNIFGFSTRVLPIRSFEQYRREMTHLQDDIIDARDYIKEKGLAYSIRKRLAWYGIDPEPVLDAWQIHFWFDPLPEWLRATPPQMAFTLANDGTDTLAGYTGTTLSAEHDADRLEH